MQLRGGTVTADWALWGKTSSDSGYHLLECGDGTIGPTNFEEIADRYSPGTLEDLPQVTFGWLADEAHSYLSVAIHERAIGRSIDAGGREIVFTRLFCVPFYQLAGNAVSYGALFGELNKQELPRPDGAPVTVRPPRGTAGGADPRAMRVAAMLLTSRPVCVLRAERAPMIERLRFLDEVASFLPYGMRGQLSASTWVSSTFEQHKIRLYFAGAAREDRDQVVVWGQDNGEPLGHKYADDFLDWLRLDPDGARATLAKDAEPSGFGQQDICAMLERVGVIPTGLPASIGVGQPNFVGIGTASVEDRLMACARWLDGPEPQRLVPDLQRLRTFLSTPTSEEDRRRYREIIKGGRLLRPDPRLDGTLATELSTVLLQIAFTTPFGYADYCHLEDCAVDGLHVPLLHAVRDVAGADSSRVLLLRLHALGKPTLRGALHDNPVAPEVLIAAANAPDLRRGHAQILCRIAADDLRARADRLDPVSLRMALRRHQFLAPALRRAFPESLDDQLELLDRILSAAYRGGKLDLASVTEILADPTGPPTVALCAAVAYHADPWALPEVARVFLHTLVRDSSFALATRDHLAALLSVPPPPVALQAVTSSPAPPRAVAEARVAEGRVTEGRVTEKAPATATPRDAAGSAAGPGAGRDRSWIHNPDPGSKRFIVIIGSAAIVILIVALVMLLLRLGGHG
jgi:hypothetical protein